MIQILYFELGCFCIFAVVRLIEPLWTFGLQKRSPINKLLQFPFHSIKFLLKQPAIQRSSKNKKRTPTVGLEPTTTRLRALRSTD